MGTKSCTKIFHLQMAGNVLSWRNLSPRFSNGGCHVNLDAARPINCTASFLRALGDKQKTLETQTQTQTQNGDCDAVIAKASAVVTHVQSLSQEVGSGDEGLGLFDFDLSSAEPDFWWLGKEQRGRNRNQYMASTWGHGFRRSWRI